jgi:hypothetical protein
MTSIGIIGNLFTFVAFLPDAGSLRDRSKLRAQRLWCNGWLPVAEAGENGEALVRSGRGEVAERFNAAVLKTAGPLRAPRVRIPSSPDSFGPWTGQVGYACDTNALSSCGSSCYRFQEDRKRLIYFWDLDNVAFSHAWRNARARQTTKRMRHADFLPLAAFVRNNAKWSGLQSFCRECTKEAERGA